MIVKRLSGSAEEAELRQLIDLLKNLKTYEERLNKLISAENAALKAKNQLTKAEKLDELITNAQIDEQAAKAYLVEAKSEAKALVDGAKNEASAIKASIKDEVKDSEILLSSLKSEIEKAQADLDNLQRQKTAVEAQTQTIKAEAEKIKAEAQARLNEINERKQKLQETLTNLGQE